MPCSPLSRCGDDDGEDTINDSRVLFVFAIATVISEHISLETVEKMQFATFCLKQRLFKIAWQVYNESLLFDGDRISLSTKAQRYVELVCLLLDREMLTEVFFSANHM
jgi:hypothetical protein